MEQDQILNIEEIQEKILKEPDKYIKKLEENLRELEVQIRTTDNQIKQGIQELKNSEDNRIVQLADALEQCQTEEELNSLKENITQMQVKLEERMKEILKNNPQILKELR